MKRAASKTYVSKKILEKYEKERKKQETGEDKDKIDEKIMIDVQEKNA